MEYFNNIRCVTARELLREPEPVMTEEGYKSYLRRNKHVRMRRSVPGGSALLAYDRLRDDIKERYVAKYGDPAQLLQRNPLEEMITPDMQAAEFYSKYELPDGSNLKFEVQREYMTNACLLNAMHRLISDRTSKARALGNRPKNIWRKLSNAAAMLDREKWPHTLPSNPVRLQEKMRKYLSEGYLGMVHRGYGNMNSRKVNEAVERLLLSLYCRKNLPFGEWVHDDYLKFVAGELTIVDGETGEIYDREDFYEDKKGSYITISRATVWNVITNPENALIIDRLRSSRIDHYTKATPYNRRHAPLYSISKISADDRTLPRKTTDGTWVNAYYIFDVASQVVLSSVYSLEKPNVQMVWDCFRQMYRTLDEHNLMWPIELECENHLMRNIEPELRQMFGFVNFTPPGTSQSKRAEHFIHCKKYVYEKRKQEGIGRWYGKGAYKTKSENKDPDYKEPRLPYEQIVAEDRQSIHDYNYDLHPDQKIYPGKTRWDVLTQHMNPDAGRPEKYKLFYFMGEKTETTIRNNDAVRVQYQDYGIDSYEILRRLKPNNYSVLACYVRRSDGSIPEVFLYQDEKLLTRAGLLERYNEALAERTERDEEIRVDQAKRKAKFFKREKDLLNTKINRKIEVLQTENVQEVEEMEAVVVELLPINRDEVDLEAAFAKFNPERWRDKSINEL